MTKDEALKRALETWDSWEEGALDHPLSDVMEAIREALAQDEPVIWVLTSEYNAYDQYGAYFEAVFIGKPTSKQIQEHCQVNEEDAVHILSGGGRVGYENHWYNLRQEEATHGITGNAPDAEPEAKA